MKDTAVPNTANGRTTKRRARHLAGKAGTIGADPAMRSYSLYLINCYNYFAQAGRPEEKFSYGLMYRVVERKFGAKWDAIPVSRFRELSEYLQGRINLTKVGRIRKARGTRNYRPYEEYSSKRCLVSQGQV